MTRDLSRKRATPQPRSLKHSLCMCVFNLDVGGVFLVLGCCYCVTFSAGVRGVAEVLAAQQAEEIMVSKQLLDSLELVSQRLYVIYNETHVSGPRLCAVTPERCCRKNSSYIIFLVLYPKSIQRRWRKKWLWSCLGSLRNPNARCRHFPKCGRVWLLFMRS